MQLLLRLFIQGCGLTAAGTGIVALVGWFTGIIILASIKPFYLPMAPNAAILFIISGIVLTLLSSENPRGLQFMRAAIAVVILISAVRLFEVTSGISLNVDRWIVHTSGDKLLGRIATGQMATSTSVEFLILGAAILLSSFRGNQMITNEFPRVLAVGGTALSLVYLLGYIYGVPLSYAGTTIPMALNAAYCFFLLGTGIFTRGMVKDIVRRKNIENTLRRMNDQLENANRELKAFSYSVSHDLRAPLRAIDGFSQALLEDCGDRLNKDETEHLRRIRAATRRMSELIDDLLKLAWVAQSETRRELIDLTGMASEICEGLRKSGQERNAEFIISEGITVMGDPLLMRLVLENLFGNAWKFTSKCPLTRIEFGRMNQNGKSVYFVRDNGAGFDMKYSGKLFGTFQRLHNVSEFPGTGIGLATVQRIIHRHGGQTWAEGEINRGATFYFTIPEGDSCV